MKADEQGTARGRRAPGSRTLRERGAAALLAGLALWAGASIVALGALVLGEAHTAAGLVIVGSGLIGGLLLIAVGQSILVVVDIDES